MGRPGQSEREREGDPVCRDDIGKIKLEVPELVLNGVHGRVRWLLCDAAGLRGQSTTRRSGSSAIAQESGDVSSTQLPAPGGGKGGARQHSNTLSSIAA
jgi:hypothetical protein